MIRTVNIYQTFEAADAAVPAALAEFPFKMGAAAPSISASLPPGAGARQCLSRFEAVHRPLTNKPDVRMVTWPSQPLRTDVWMIDMASGYLGGRYVRMRTWPSGPPGPRYVRMGNLTYIRIIRGPSAANAPQGKKLVHDE